MAKKEVMIKPPVGLVVKNNPLPIEDRYKDDIKIGLSKLNIGECLETPMPSNWEKGVVAWQRYVSTIAYNYKIKTQTTNFTVRVINDTTIGIWIKQ